MILSIIIPCFNQVSQLFECLQSIRKQTFKSYEIILVDGGCSEDIIKYILILKAENIHLISEPDLGIYDAMNKGIDLAKGNWLYFIGVDDAFYDNNVLESLIFSFKKDDIKLIAGEIKYEFNNQDSIFVKKNKGLIKPIWSKKIWLRNTLHHQALFYHKSVFKQARFDIKYKILADYAFNIQLWKQQKPVLILDRVIAKCGTQGVSKQYDFNLYWEELILKTRSSSVILFPLFVILSMVKYSFKKIEYFISE
ncbi:glycosyltransferase family 2 protein [Thalassobellus citreus]|uniref:glycosyltransferase family 2 protein n=1 Tax=Thalassobellus citreus TaxID=3367752 RepID=UPI00378CEE63